MRREGKETLHEYPRCFDCRFTPESGVRVTQEEQDDVRTHRRMPRAAALHWMLRARHWTKLKCWASYLGEFLSYSPGLSHI